ncbi:MAG: ankyrin repeat domain-containing protein [Planctomycetota bacterium]
MTSAPDLTVLLETGPLDPLLTQLDDQPRRVHTFLARPADHGPEQWMPLHVAAHAGHLAAVHALLDRGVHPDCRTRFTTPMHARQTALHLAAAAGHAEVAQRLLEAAAEIEVRDAQQRSPLWLAARHRHPALLTRLARRGAALDPRDRQQRPPLHAALLPADDPASFDPAAALALLDAGADIHLTCPKDPDGYTPLHRCVTLGDPALPVAQRLLDAGADPDATDPRFGRSPRQLAEHLGRAAYLELLP